MKFKILLLLTVAFYSSIFSQNNCYTNASFEGPSQAHVVPDPWNTCWGTPDTQPGQWGITLAPSNGSSYISCLCMNGYGYNEGTTQPLTTCMVAGQQYTFTVDLAHSPVYNTAEPGDCYSSFAVWGGNNPCEQSELLYCSGEIWNTNWQTYTITFTPTQNWCYIGFSPCYIHDCNGYINVLIDNISCIVPAVPTITTTPTSCFGSCDGTAQANVISGTPPYSYLWSNGATTQTISGLCAGDISLTITDAASQTSVATATVSQPSLLQSNITSSNVSCYGLNNGSAYVHTIGGDSSI